MKFADSFWKSLETLTKHQTWWYKLYELFRRKIPYFLENIWFFRKELWEFRSWDYGYNLMMFRRSLEKTVNTIEFHGMEVPESRLKKVQKIKRVIELLGNVRSDSYIESAEKELGEIKHYDWEFEDVPDMPGYKKVVDDNFEEEKQHNRRVFNRANEIEKEEWDELWKILQGQDHNEYVKLMESTSEEDKRKNDLWYKWFDGSGMKHWWD